MKVPRILWLSILLFQHGCHSATPAQTPAAQTTATRSTDAAARGAQKPPEPPHYKAKRDKLSISLNTLPAVRFRCTVDLGGRQRVVEWDPNTDHELGRTLLVPPTDAAGDVKSVACGSEVLMNPAEKSEMPPHQYVLASSSTGTQTYELKSLTTATESKAKLTVKYSVERSVEVALADILEEEIPIARTRSLDPLTPIVADLAVVAASIAVERAKTTAAKIIQRNLVRRLCWELTEANLKNLSIGRSLALNDTPQPLFPSTCELVQTTTTDTLAAMPRLLARALTADLSKLLTRALHNAPVPEDVRAVLAPTISSVVAALVESRAILTERDSQLLLLQVAQIGLCTPQDTGKTSDVCLARAAVEAGILLVAECVRDGQCSADDLQRRMLDEEKRDPHIVGEAFKKWRSLLPVLARAVDVFQPPPGTTAKVTAKVALNSVIDILGLLVGGQTRTTYEQEKTQPKPNIEELRKSCAKKGGDVDIALCKTIWSNPETTVEQLTAARDAQQQTADVGMNPKFEVYLKLLRELVDSAADDEPERAAQAVGALLADMIAEEVEGCQKADCDRFEDFDPADVRKVFGVLNAILAYTSTYQGRSGDDRGAEVEKLRQEERKKAMQQLIDAATDRRGRGRDAIVSLGVAVGGNYAYFGSQHSSETGFGVSLPAGIALEWLPGDWRIHWYQALGLHLQLTAFDLSQYVSAPNGDNVEPEPGTSILPGLRGGVLIGESNLCLLVGGGAGYAPQARFKPGDKEGMVRAEVFAGLYVPFFDLN
jgi:hypothetical protein